MTNLSKFKKRNSLGQPPAEASNNLAAPEHAPAVLESVPQVAPVVTAPAAPTAPPLTRGALISQTPAPLAPAAHIDGRSLRTRRSSRTIQFSTKVTPEFDARIRQVAHRDGMLLTELLEAALDAYERRPTT